MTANNTINGRTPEEIKKGLECCSPRYESKHWVSCSSECPFMNEGVYCRNVLHACNKKYIHRLERERDAAVEDIFPMCTNCKHEKLGFGVGPCPPIEEFVTTDCSNWQWRGVPQEVE